MAGPDRLGVIEGVMGYYDGLGGSTDRASSYEVAERTHTPVILVADGQGRSFSTLAAVRGFLNFRPDSHIKGVLIHQGCPPCCTRPLNGRQRKSWGSGPWALCRRWERSSG